MADLRFFYSIHGGGGQPQPAAGLFFLGDSAWVARLHGFQPASDGGTAGRGQPRGQTAGLLSRGIRRTPVFASFVYTIH
jgi:hypothetical protein